jgi:hypothetical protein
VAGQQRSIRAGVAADHPHYKWWDLSAQLDRFIHNMHTAL